MARRRRSARRSSTSRKGSGSFSRKLLIGLGITLPILWVVFTKLLFDPFEAPVPSFRLLVPRDVDLYLHREKLAADLDPTADTLPVPLVLQRWMRTLPWRDFAATEWAKERSIPATVEELFGELGELAKTDTGPLSLVDDLLGEELAIIGRDPFTAGSYAALFRLSAKGKLAVEALGFGQVRQGVLAGATHSQVVDEHDPSVRFSQLDLPSGESIFYFRQSDLLVLGNSQELVASVRDTVNRGPELSLGLSRLYGENVPGASLPAAQRFSADFALDLQHTVVANDWKPDLDRRREDAVANILPRLVSVDRLRDAVGRLEFDKRFIDLDLFVDVAGDGVKQSTGGVQGADTYLVHERLSDALSLLPRGTAAVQTLNVDLTEFLRSIVDGLDPDLVKLINDTIRDVARWNPSFNVANLSQLIDEMDKALLGKLTIALRPLDHEIPPGTQPVPALAFIAPIRNAAAWDAIGQAMINGNSVLGVAGEQMWQQTYGGLGTHKFLPLPATSAEGISFIVLDGETLVLSTDSDFTQEIIAAYSGTGRTLLAEPGVSDLLLAFQRGKTRANVAVWADARLLRQVLDPYADWRADNETALDFAVLRAQQRKELIRQKHKEYVGREDSMPADLNAALERELDDIIDGLEAERVATTVPALASRIRESNSWLALLKQGVFSLRAGEHTMGAALHLETVVD